MASVGPSIISSLDGVSPSRYEYNTDGESTIPPSEEGDRSDITSDTEVIDLLSDTHSCHGGDDGDGQDRKASPAPTSFTVSSASSVQFLAAVKSDPPTAACDDIKPDTKTIRPSRTSIPRGTIVRMSEVEQAKIVTLLEAGWSQARIAEHLNRPARTICSFIRRRRAKMQQFAASLPGSIPISRAAPGTSSLRSNMANVKNEHGNGGTGSTSARARPAKRERAPTPGFHSVDGDARDIKPNKRAKKEESV